MLKAEGDDHLSRMQRRLDTEITDPMGYIYDQHRRRILPTATGGSHIEDGARRALKENESCCQYVYEKTTRSQVFCYCWYAVGDTQSFAADQRGRHELQAVDSKLSSHTCSIGITNAASETLDAVLNSVASNTQLADTASNSLFFNAYLAFHYSGLNLAP